MTADRINEAVNQCLSRCYTAPNPLAALVGYVEELRAGSEWSAYEVDLVETNARRILMAVLDSGESE